MHVDISVDCSGHFGCCTRCVTWRRKGIVHFLLAIFTAMNDLFTRKSRIIITCNSRLSPWLTQEMMELGIDIERSFLTGVEALGTLADCIPLNLRLRAASQILYSLDTFQAEHPDDVYEAVKKIAWEDILKDDGFFSVTSNVQHPTINNTMFTNLRVKDAIVDRIRDSKGTRPSSGSSAQGLVVHLFWKDGDAEIFIDSSGESLARHGYRKIPGKAPMLEALAFSTILATGWDRRSPFVNPMCGSGTLAIEAALLATNRYPGLFRNNYSFMHLRGYDDTLHQKSREEMEAAVNDQVDLQIIASDNSSGAIENASLNALAAGVRKKIRFEVCDFAATPIPATEKGVIFFNPEYGERLGEIPELTEKYARIGDYLKNKCQNYTGFVFSGNFDLVKKIRLNPARKIEFYNARIDCRLFRYELYSGSRRKDRQDPVQAEPESGDVASDPS